MKLKCSEEALRSWQKKPKKTPQNHRTNNNLPPHKTLATILPIFEDTDLNKNLDNGFPGGVMLHKYLLAYIGKVTAK